MNLEPVVFICAHPDDIFCVAGTLALLRQKGHPVYDFCLTPGQRGYHLPDEIPTAGLKPPRPDVAARRTQEEQAACAVLGAELVMFNEMDGELFAGREICTTVAARLADIKPRAVLTLWVFDKPDHSAAFSVAHTALHLAGLYWTTEFYLAPIDPAGYQFQPTIYVNVSSVIEQKKAVLRCYAGQFGPENAAAHLQHARILGRNIFSDYAEVFATTTPLVGTRWDRPAEVGRLLLSL
jgi:LmbE family N-acetylglucosaminyl deacetylase